MGALIATSIVPVHSGGSGASPRGLVLVACPGTGPVLAVIEPGQRLLVTGRSDDGTWLQVYLPGPGLTSAWAPARELQPSGDPNTLPVASCNVAVASPTGTPIVAEVTPSPTPPPTPTPTPTPTATPLNSSPIIADLAASPATIYYPWGGIGPSCGPNSANPNETTITATITDPEGVASATLFYRLPTRAYASKAMTRAGSTYAASVNVPLAFNHTGDLTYYVVSKDGSPEAKTRTSPVQTVTVKKCNIPPSVTDMTFSSQAGAWHAYARVQGKSCGSTKLFAGILVATTDPDGLTEDMTVVFWYTPWHGTLHHVTLKYTNATGFFTGKLFPTDFPAMPNSNSRTMDSWYVTATDTAGGRTTYKLPGQTITEDQCP
jgi:hypothetical protein